MKHLLISILLLNVISIAYTEPLTWIDTVNKAQSYNPALIKARESVKQSEINYNLSRTNFLPTVSASASSSRSGTDKPVSAANDNYSYGLNGQWMLNNVYSDINQIKIKDIDRKIDELRFKRTISDVIYNIRRSFINLLVAQEMFDLSGQIMGRRMKNLDLVQLKYDAGREDKGSLLRVDADRLQAQYDYDSAKRNLETASLQLAKDIGINSYEIIQVTGSFNINLSSKDISIENAIVKIPEYLIAKYNMDKTEINMKTAKSNLYPDLSFTGSISKSWTKSIDDNTNWSTGFSLSYPLYNAGRDINNIKLAESNKIIIENSLQETELQLKTSLRNAYSNYINAIENLNIRQKYLIAAEQQSEITTMKYVNGLAAYYDWYNVENDVISYQKMMLNSKRDVILAESSLKNVQGIGE